MEGNGAIGLENFITCLCAAFHELGDFCAGEPLARADRAIAAVAPINPNRPYPGADRAITKVAATHADCACPTPGVTPTDNR